jgi:predicted transcriptional regulator with HTH domain
MEACIKGLGIIIKGSRCIMGISDETEKIDQRNGFKLYKINDNEPQI